MKKVNIKTLLHIAGLAIVLAANSSANAATEILDQVVAIVDDDIIMASELRQRMAVVTKSLESRGVDMPPEDALVRETLDRLILENIQMQIATRVGVRISDAQLTAAVSRIAGKNRMSIEEFRARLESDGQSYTEMRNDIRREMILQRVQSGNVNQMVQISQQEIDNFLATDEGQQLTQPEFRIVHALLPLSPDADEASVTSAKSYSDKMLARVRAGEPFDVVIASSKGPYTFSGGDLGWRKAGDLPSLFADIAPTLAIGEAAEPIRSDSGFHLVYLQDMKGGVQMASQTEVRHILVKPSEIMTDEQARQLTANLRARIIAGEEFGDLAKEYSEDIGTAQEGGHLGWSSPGQMVPEFEKTMAETEIGTVSEPVHSQFGWHILEVTGRRDKDMTELAIRSKANEYLHGRKYQEELDAWLRKIRDEAFVDIK
ncbi:MAG: peptidyl-prolyl cis-trans isomerase SurA [Halioglobus sp.]